MPLRIGKQPSRSCAYSGGFGEVTPRVAKGSSGLDIHRAPGPDSVRTAARAEVKALPDRAAEAEAILAGRAELSPHDLAEVLIGVRKLRVKLDRHLAALSQPALIPPA